MKKDLSEGGTPDTVGELFDTDVEGPDPARGHSLSELGEDERRRALDWFPDRLGGNGLSREYRKSVRRLSMWTFGTVALALFASLLLGFLTMDTGPAVFAFVAGILSGGSGMLLGVGLLAGSFR